MKRGVIALTIAACSAGALANQECAKITSDQRRLACYDAEYRPATSTSTSSKWSVREDVSPIDDSKTVVLSVSSTETVQTRFRRTASPRLILRCHENTTSFYISFGGLHMADHGSYGDVDLRVDKKPSKTYSMAESTDNKALGLWNGHRSIPAIKSMFRGKTLTIRATPFSESPVTLQFPISGLEEAIKPLREACTW